MERGELFIPMNFPIESVREDVDRGWKRRC
jgi:hypothetical protein